MVARQNYNHALILLYMVTKVWFRFHAYIYAEYPVVMQNLTS